MLYGALDSSRDANLEYVSLIEHSSFIIITVTDFRSQWRAANDSKQKRQNSSVFFTWEVRVGVGGRGEGGGAGMAGWRSGKGRRTKG